MTSVARPGQTFYHSPAGDKQEGSEPSCTAPTRFNQRAQTEGGPSSPPPRAPSRPRPAEAPAETGGDRGEAKRAGLAPTAPRAADATAEAMTAAAAATAARRAEGKGRGGKGGSASGLAPLPDALTHRSWRRPRGTRAATRARARTCRPRLPLERFPCSRPGGSRDCRRVGSAPNAHAPQ